MSGAPAIRAHRFRLEPSGKQAIALKRALDARRYVYNWGLQRWGEYYAAEGASPPRGLLSAEITRLKRNGELAWLRDLPSQLPQQALLDLERSFKAFFEKRAGYPRFRRKKELKASCRLPQHVKVSGNRVYVPKIGWIRARVSRAPGPDLGSATVSRTADRKWFVSINERFMLPAFEASGTGAVVGVDLGLIDIVVCDDGHRVAAPRFARRSARQVRTAQRRYARTQPGSRRRERARYRLARVHARVANRRQDFIHKLTTEIIRRHDVVVIEDLSLTALARTKLGKSFGDAALGEVSRQLGYKTSWSGKRTITVDRFFPSTRRCSRCHALAASLALSERAWRCACGANHDRDVNAALNLRDEGLRLLRDRGAHGHEQSPPSLGKTTDGGTGRRSGNRELMRMPNRFDSGLD